MEHIDEAMIQLSALFTASPDGVIIQDVEGNIQRLNPAALALLELTSEEECKSMPFQQLMDRYQPRDAQLYPAYDDSLSTIIGHKPASSASKHSAILTLPSHNAICVDITSTPLSDNQQQLLGVLHLFHDMSALYQSKLESQRANKAIFTLIKAISHIHESIYAASPEEDVLHTPSMDVIGQQLTDLISQLLKTPAVLLVSFKRTPEQKLHYIAISGLPDKQVQIRKQASGHYPLSEFLQPEEIAQLERQQIVCVERANQRSPFSITSTASTRFMWIPLVIQNQVAGVLIIGRIDPCTEEEMALIKAVATLTTLLTECVKLFARFKDPRLEGIVLKETNAIINEFLNLASHEFRTPLTVTMGNIQLALRRLEKLRSEMAGQSEELSRGIERVLNPLEYASQSTRVHERMIGNIIDDSRLQAHKLELHVSRADLRQLVAEVVRTYQRRHPDRQIELEIDPLAEPIEVMVDANRVKQVTHIYLTNAIQFSPEGQPITVKVREGEKDACVYVHDNGPGIAPEDQKLIWERFYRAKGTALQNELDLSLGLSLYLCKELIQLHHGEVGVKSNPGQGETFWFMLPLSPTSSS
ncbi:hypothetical protein KDH_48140 [Dictyobacter sp. S3.2.2.5]|uniref:histidine kinase n=2 Tax=Dictyobacter halimunensis TaxID=3026934 RepID=A0ABQ6FXL1_9CHLR|nr:hypothetical protein KDH_48140 [Dictyobacter sp. S3.2.2.5]